MSTDSKIFDKKMKAKRVDKDKYGIHDDQIKYLLQKIQVKM
jgi:hypothetical protein